MSNQNEQLDVYYQQVKDIILARQDWVTGLLPASTAINTHGNYTDAWVRDNVYSILAAWGLALAYRRSGEHKERVYELEQSTVKLMRGLLTAMMRQADKVERFKHTQNPLDALHAKYDTQTGVAVVGDHEWGHLQLDATSLFLLMLAQMTASGLRIVFTLAEVNFVQNLVHYISRTYRTPDYGIWERGHKINSGEAELNASSIGMAKAALEALSDFNLFGELGGQASVIHVNHDDIAHTRITLESLLPRESISKEVDAAVLSVIGFPAFAVDNDQLRQQTLDEICEKLEGDYGCKRFLRDGHQTAIEDHNRLHYEAHELKQFADIECEWPLFFTYLLLNHLFTGNEQKIQHYLERLDAVSVEKNGYGLLPEVYWVAEEHIDAERENPGSQPRLPNDNVPLVWAQSLFILGSLVQDGLLHVEDLDPLARHKASAKDNSGSVQVLLLAEDDQVQQQLAQQDLYAITMSDIAPIQIREAEELSEALTQLGRNDRIGLSGRPLRQLRSLATSCVYQLAGELMIFLPQCLNQKGFYLAMDNRFLIQRLSLELSYVYHHWDVPDQPLMTVPIKQNMLEGSNQHILFDFLQDLKQGEINRVPVQLVTLNQAIKNTRREVIDYLHGFNFADASWDQFEQPLPRVLVEPAENHQPLPAHALSQWENEEDEVLVERLLTENNLYAQLELVALLISRHGMGFGLQWSGDDEESIRLDQLLEDIYDQAGDRHLWYVVRRAAGVLGKYDINLAQAANEILLRQHGLTLGRSYSGKATLKKPADSSEILSIINQFNTDPSERAIIQELILCLGLLMKSDADIFTDMHTVRVGHILHLLCVWHKRESGCESLDQAFDQTLAMSPYQLATKVREMLADFSNIKVQLKRDEALHYQKSSSRLAVGEIKVETMAAQEDDGNWYEWREQQGSFGRDVPEFFENVWLVLHHCRGVVIGDKLNSKNRLDSDNILSEMTAEEQSFKLYVSHLLNKIQAPMYRQLTVEALNAAAMLMRTNENLQIEDVLVVDVLIGHAVRLKWLHTHPEEQDYEQHVAMAWQSFYQQPPDQIKLAIKDSLDYLLCE